MRGKHQAALALVAAAGIGIGGCGTAAGAVPDDALVHTEGGPVRGTVSGGVRTFQGIPYAAPPVGALRWQDPKPAAHWTAERDGTHPGSACAQGPTEIPSGSKSEDCLYLNVTAPSHESVKPKPVVVWIHGGGFFQGAGSNYDARRLAERGDLVVVTINYRLGVFGFFGHPGLPGSGTFGLRDQQAAMAWVHRNAARFGGDPGNVTVAGQSAGAISACAHLTSPAATGLFDKAVLQSGSCATSWLGNFEYRGQPADAIYEPLPALEAQGDKAAAELGCTGTDNAAVLSCLRGLPVDALLPQLGKFIQPAYGTPLLPEDPATAVHSGRVHRVPVLSGNTHDEMTQSTSFYDAGEPMTEQTYQAVMSETFGTDRAAVEAEYPRAAYDSAALAWAALTTDRKWACTQYRTAGDLARRVPVYQYEFADPAPPLLSPLPPKMPMGAQHASDLWSLFDLQGRAPEFTPEQQRLSDRMIGYWAGFAASGVPRAPDAPSWSRFRPGAHPPYVQALAPGAGGIHPVDLATQDHCRFWAEFDAR
ncbi:carboxylesterase/lipase family protein [Amycolatopsis jiangsuensis]|uniref:Carboxylic ester hydrolase n=1 Tax=Amycolatopsis jiangsuensis TaxID=1181879 RepID=A0A840J5M5_9PSEU|nr:carboxylesterase family protein [Amycolatopsis jiangsuensis]MBB4688732.1 para-nitrobenzyl esterase [Amycolatopsis jiangsuensis]